MAAIWESLNKALGSFGSYILTVLLGLVLLYLLIYLISSKTKPDVAKRMKRYRLLYVLGIPGMMILILFNYLPMGSLFMAFEDYDPWKGLFVSPFVGLKHFHRLFSDPKFYQMLRNTLTISFLSLLTFPAPIILALLLNRTSRGARISSR